MRRLLGCVQVCSAQPGQAASAGSQYAQYLGSTQVSKFPSQAQAKSCPSQGVSLTYCSPVLHVSQQALAWRQAVTLTALVALLGVIQGR